MERTLHGGTRDRLRLDPGATIRAMGRFGRDAFLSVVAAFRRDPASAAWLLLWSPFWIGSVAPPPRRSWRTVDRFTFPPRDEAGQYLAAQVGRLTRRFGLSWMAGSILRGMVIALAALNAWALLAAVDMTSPPSLGAAVIVTAIAAVAGIIHGWYLWPSRLMVTHMLDRTFWLNERMVTAFERSPSTSRLSRIQLADAANTFDDIAPGLPRSTFLPLREGILCLLFAGALLTVLLAGTSQREIAPLELAPVPQFLVASERLMARDQPVVQPPSLADTPADQQASIADIQERGRASQDSREDLSVLAKALEQYPLTQPAAKSMANGNYAEAADLLRTAADSVESMDQQSRDAMADDLDEAAQQMSETNPELAQQARDTADALREGGPGASDAMRDLADQVEETGGQVESQESLAQELDEATSNSSGSNQGGEQGSSQEPGQGGSGNEQGAGEEGTGTDPGQGVEAQPGVSNQEQPSEGGSAGSEGSENASEQGAGSGAGDDGPGEQPAESNGGEGNGEISSDSSGAPGSSQDSASAPDEETSASQGSGAGSGQSNANDQSEGGNVDDPNEVEENPDTESPAAGQPGDPPPSRADRGEDDDSRGSSSQGESSLQLQGTSDESVPSGGNSGTSSTGDGGSSSTASGDLASEEPGIAGPDSNRVPPSLREVVQGYFESPEEP